MISVLRLTLWSFSARWRSFSIIIFYCEILILAIVKCGREELKRQTDKKQR